MATKFSWIEFPIEFIKAVLSSPNTPRHLNSAGKFSDKDFLIPYMDSVCSFPDDRFVRRYRREIENYFLTVSSGSLVSICKRLERANYGGVHISNNQEEMLMCLRQKRLTQTLSSCYVSELVSYGRKTTRGESSLFTEPKVIDLEASAGTDEGLFDYQESAVAAMESRFLKENGKAGFLVMPTGSGKTRTSTHFLIKDMVSRGYQVLWLAHRSMLIEQAAESFYRLSPLARINDSDRQSVKMVCISGEHCSSKAMETDDDIIVASVQSLCRNTEYLTPALKEKVIIVVDEAHHAVAPSYRRIIKAVRKTRPDAKLLGLTATPVRISDKDTAALMRMFENNIIYSVTMGELIADGTLSRPEYIARETNLDIEAIIDIDERKFIQKWKEMPESLLEKVAKTNSRNELIVDEYVRNREKYGKTLVFALNAIHCCALDDEFKRRGIRSAFVYTLNKDNRDVIDRFRDNERPDGIDVLVNINMLTEGSDIPDIQTVFLTRPTGSDVLLMQMVGRGMRGAHCGGTAKVNIVDFCDKWSSITRWMNPKFVLEGEEGETEGSPERQYRPVYTIPFDLIRDIVSGITYRNAKMIGRNTVLPYGWYDVVDDSGNDRKVLVFQDQLDGYRRFENDMQRYIETPGRTGEDALSDFFGGFGTLPSADDLGTIIDTLRQERTFPALHSFEERDEIDPYTLAQDFRSGKLSLPESENIFAQLKQKHGGIIESIYGSMGAYRQRVSDFIFLPNGVRPIGTMVEEVERQAYTLSADPLPWSIDELLDEVIAEQWEKLPSPFRRPSIQWTDRDYASFYGVYYIDSNSIRINRLLNSASVPKEVVKYVIYHECLHQELPNHTREFRQREHLYPNFNQHDHFLDYTLRDFEREYAM